jgi:hypothetical protein
MRSKKNKQPSEVYHKTLDEKPRSQAERELKQALDQLR